MINFSKKKTLIFLILISVLIIAGGSYWYYQNRVPQPERFTNIRELFTLFTPTMEKWVNYRLQGIDCQPKEYWYANNQVCFSCNKAAACFGYAWVTRETPDQKRMNPIEIVTLKGDYSPETELAFYSYGVSKLLNCKYDQIYQCENGIEAVIIDGEAEFIFPENFDIVQKIKEIAKEIGETECKQGTEVISDFKIDFFQCGTFGAMVRQNIAIFRILSI